MSPSSPSPKVRPKHHRPVAKPRSSARLAGAMLAPRVRLRRLPVPRRIPVPARFVSLVQVPVLRRMGFHFRRMTGGVDGNFFGKLGKFLALGLLLATTLVTVTEGWKGGPRGFAVKFGDTFYWAVTTVLAAGDSSYVHKPVGFVISWILVIVGVGLAAALTGALVGFLIDYLLKEGQGMGASGYHDHIVVCGWNATARELIAELGTDEYTTKVVVMHDTDKNPAGDGVYFINGDITTSADLKRAGIEEALAAVVCPADGSNEADMKSILCVMAIETMAPHVRTVVEANNPAHVEHFQRAHADEIVVSSRLVSRLMARSSLYPGLAELVTDIVSGGDGSELYRVKVPDDYVGLSIDQLSMRLRAEHRATLLSVCRGGASFVNPPEDFRLAVGDDAIVVAESLGILTPLVPDHEI